MARIWTGGAKLGDLTMEWDSIAGAAMSVDATIFRSGASGWSIKCSGLTSGTRSGVFKTTNTTANGTRFYRFYVRFTTLPSAENTFASVAVSATVPHANLSIDNSGVVRIRQAGGAAVGVTTTLTTGTTWYLVLVKYVIGANNLITVSVNGVTLVTDSTMNDQNALGLYLGGNLNTEAQTAGTWYFDDVGVNDATGTAETSYPGDASVIRLLPNAAGDFAEGALGGSVPAATGWESVDDTTPNDGTDFWELQTDSSASATSADRLDVNVESMPTGGTPILVHVGARVKPLSNASCSYVCRVKSQASGTVVEGTTKTITGTAWVTHDDTAGSTFYSLVRYTDPQAGGAWTESLVNAMQIGVRAPDGNPNVQVTALWALVEYTPSAGGAAPPQQVFGGVFRGRAMNGLALKA